MSDYFRALVERLLGLFGDRREDRDLDDEIEAHLRLLTERYVRQGMTEAEAAWAARRRFGNITLLKEAHRDMRGIRFIETLFQDVLYGLRVLGKNPGFTFVAVFTLAIGIGANTTIFSVVNAILLRPLPYPSADRIVLINEYQQRYEFGGMMGRDFRPLLAGNRSLEQLSAYLHAKRTLMGRGQPEELKALLGTNDFLPLLGARPAMGRMFTAEEFQAGHNQVVIISHRLWQRRFGADANLIGQALTLDGKSYTVVGAMEPRFRFVAEQAGDVDLWLPLVTEAEEKNGWFGVIGRLKPGVTIRQAELEISAVTNQFEPMFWTLKGGPSVRLERLQEIIVKGFRQKLLLFWGAVGFVLLIACVNVANLLLARGGARYKELAIRAALGASRQRVVRQLLTESLLLAGLGGAAGLALSYWGLKLLVAISPAGVPRLDEAGIDARVTGVTCLASLITGALFGIAPALQFSKPDLTHASKEGAAVSLAGFRFFRWWQWPRRQATFIRLNDVQSMMEQSETCSRFLPQQYARGLLVVAEIALALVLLTGARLLIRSFQQLLAIQPGFDPERLLAVELELPYAKYPTRELTAHFIQRLIAQIESLPGVQSVGVTSDLPLRDVGVWFIRIEGRDAPLDNYKDNIPDGPPLPRNGAAGGFTSAISATISPTYFRAMGIPLKRGREFNELDNRDAPQVTIISETMAERFWPGEDPIGKRVAGGDHLNWRTVVGVVGAVRQYTLEAEARPAMYVPLLQRTDEPGRQNKIAGWVSLIARTSGPPAEWAASIRRQVWSLDPEQPINHLAAMADIYDEAVAPRRFNMLLFTVFASVALLLAAIGIYGMMSYTVAQRTREIGIRMALGAQTRDVLRMVVWQGMTLALIGVAIGLAAALAMTHVMKNLLFNVSATDPTTFALIALLLIGVALIASYVPARRATKVDPLQAIRNE